MESFEEQNLIKECRRGNLEKFGLLYDTYFDKIYRYVYFRVRHKETAQDITSQAFFKALENIKNFDEGRGYFSAWLYRIAKNAMTDYFRASRQHFNIDDLWDVASQEDIVQDAVIKEKIAKAKELLNVLNPEQREVVVMRIWDGLSHREISEVLGKSEASSKMIFFRAIARLKGLDLAMLMLVGVLIKIKGQ